MPPKRSASQMETDILDLDESDVRRERARRDHRQTATQSLLVLANVALDELQEVARPGRQQRLRRHASTWRFTPDEPGVAATLPEEQIVANISNDATFVGGLENRDGFSCYRNVAIQALLRLSPLAQHWQAVARPARWEAVTEATTLTEAMGFLWSQVQCRSMLSMTRFKHVLLAQLRTLDSRTIADDPDQEHDVAELWGLLCELLQREGAIKQQDIGVNLLVGHRCQGCGTQSDAGESWQWMLELGVHGRALEDCLAQYRRVEAMDKRCRCGHHCADQFIEILPTSTLVINLKRTTASGRKNRQPIKWPQWLTMVTGEYRLVGLAEHQISQGSGHWVFWHWTQNAELLRFDDLEVTAQFEADRSTQRGLQQGTVGWYELVA